jgi:hypothetical protein
MIISDNAPQFKVSSVRGASRGRLGSHFRELIRDLCTAPCTHTHTHRALVFGLAPRILSKSRNAARMHARIARARA